MRLRGRRKAHHHTEVDKPAFRVLTGPRIVGLDPDTQLYKARHTAQPSVHQCLQAVGLRAPRPGERLGGRARRHHLRRAVLEAHIRQVGRRAAAVAQEHIALLVAAILIDHLEREHARKAVAVIQAHAYLDAAHVPAGGVARPTRLRVCIDKRPRHCRWIARVVRVGQRRCCKGSVGGPPRASKGGVVGAHRREAKRRWRRHGRPRRQWRARRWWYGGRAGRHRWRHWWRWHERRGRGRRGWRHRRRRWRLEAREAQVEGEVRPHASRLTAFL